MFMHTADIRYAEKSPLDFMDHFNLKNLVKENTCFKSITNPTCIDLFLTNNIYSFHHTAVVATGISDFHKIILTIFRTTFTKRKPKEILYRDYKNLNVSSFNDDLQRELNKFSNNIISFENFETTFLKILNNHAPMKKKFVQANEVPYMTKKLKKAIYKRSRLNNKYCRDKTVQSEKEYKQHRNFCSRLYKKERRNYYINLDDRKIIENTKFWTTMKPFFTNKGASTNKSH